MYRVNFDTLILSLLLISSVLFQLSLINVFQNALGEQTMFVIRMTILVFMLISLVKEKFKLNKKLVFILFLSSASSIFSFSITKYYIDLITLIVTVFIFLNLDVMKRTKYLYYSSNVFILINVILFILFLLGFNLHSVELVDFDINKGNFDSVSNSLGFKNPNNYSYFIMISTLLYFLLRKEVLMYFSVFLAIVTYFYTGTQTMLLVVILLLGYKLVNYYFEDKIRYVFIVSFISVLLFLITLLYNPEIYLNLNLGTLLPRLLDFVIFINLITANLHLLLFGGEDLFYDCMFTNLIGGVGIFVFLVIMYYVIKSIIYYMNKKKYDLVFYIMIVLSIGVVENILFSSSFLSVLFYALISNYENNLELYNC